MTYFGVWATIRDNQPAISLFVPKYVEQLLNLTLNHLLKIECDDVGKDLLQR